MCWVPSFVRGGGGGEGVSERQQASDSRLMYIACLNAASQLSCLTSGLPHNSGACGVYRRGTSPCLAS